MKRSLVAWSGVLSLGLCLTGPSALRADDGEAPPWTSRGATWEAQRAARLHSTTDWDYQPGQGPRRSVSPAVAHTQVTPQVEPIPGPVPQQVVAAPNAPVPEAWRTADPPAVPPRAPLTEPRTETSIEFGGQFGNYHYEEHELDVRLDGLKFGLTGVLTGSLYDGWFARADGRFATGDVQYNGSGKKDNNPDYTAEVRLLGGRDFIFGRFGISPVTGIGYRYLFDNMHGLTDSGASGYGRMSQYLYVPIGIEPRYLLPGGDKISLSFEYDQLIRGWQFSYLSDVSPAYPDIENTQHGGYGLRGQANYTTGNWSTGPYFYYWNIDRSNSSCGIGDGDGQHAYLVCGYEPHNTTIDYGWQFRYRFY